VTSQTIPSGPTEGNDADKVTFGPSASNKDTLEMLVAQGHFKTSVGAFQAAAMLAIRKGLDPNAAATSAGTMWNRGSVKKVLDFLTWYLPTTTPVRALEQLGNVGTAFIGERVRTGVYSLSDIFELPRADVD
jgi:hypothetical protein